MTFLIQAFDHTDAEALQRRMSVRDAHLKVARKMHDEGKLLFGGAILGTDGSMKGSVVLVEMESLEEVEKWLAEEIYLSSNVWDKVSIYPLKVAIP